MIIHVTQDDINKGCIQAARMCPVALAIERVIGHEVTVSPCDKTIDEDNIYNWEVIFYHLPYHKRIILPNEVKEFARSFDMGRSVSPFEFELDYTE